MDDHFYKVSDSEGVVLFYARSRGALSVDDQNRILGLGVFVVVECSKAEYLENK